MFPTRPALCATLLLALACERRGETPPPPAPPPPPPAPAAPTAAAAPESNKLPPGMEAAPPLPAEAEVELIGKLDGAPAGTQLRVLVGRTPCTAKDTGAPYGVERANNIGATSPFFIEVFVPQGATGHVCGYAVKDGKVQAFAAWEKNPVTMRGAGEVMFTEVGLKLQPVKPALAAPAGL